MMYYHDNMKKGSVNNGRLERKIQLGLVLLLAILLLALCLRIADFSMFKKSPFFNNLFLDSLLYDETAQNIAKGDLLGEGPFYTGGPLYQYVLGLIYWTLGRNFNIVFALQILLGVFSCFLIYLIAKRVFNQTVGLIACFMASAYSMLIFYDTKLLTTSLGITLLLLFSFFAIKASESHKLRDWILTGAFLGLGSLARPNFMIFMIPAIFWIVFTYFNKKTYLFKVIPAFIISFFLMLMPIMIRNYIVLNEFVLISAVGGGVLYIANNPKADGANSVANALGRGVKGPLEQIKEGKKHADSVYGYETTYSEMSNYWAKAALNFIISQPKRFFWLMQKKFALYWNEVEVPHDFDYYFFKHNGWTLGFPLFSFILIAPLALGGIFLSLENWRKTLFIYMIIASHFLSLLIFYVYSRIRLPVVPFLIIMAAFCVWRLYKLALSRKLIKLAKTCTIIVLAFLFVRLPVVRTSFATGHHMVASAYLRNNELDKAIEEFKKSILVDSGIAHTHIVLGKVYNAKGDLDKSIYQFEEAQKIEPNNYVVLCALSRLYLKKGMLEKAKEYAEHSIRSYSGLAESHYLLGLAFIKKGGYRKAEQCFKEALAINPKHKDTRFSMAFTLSELGEKQKAKLIYEKLLEEPSPSPKAAYNLAYIHGEEGNIDKAITLLKSIEDTYHDKYNLHRSMANLYMRKNLPELAELEYKKAERYKKR